MTKLRALIDSSERPSIDSVGVLFLMPNAMQVADVVHFVSVMKVQLHSKDHFYNAI